MKHIIISLAMTVLVPSCAPAITNAELDRLIPALIQVESGGNDSAVGDFEEILLLDNSVMPLVCYEEQLEDICNVKYAQQTNPNHLSIVIMIKNGGSDTTKKPVPNVLSPKEKEKCSQTQNLQNVKGNLQRKDAINTQKKLDQKNEPLTTETGKKSTRWQGKNLDKKGFQTQNGGSQKKLDSDHTVQRTNLNDQKNNISYPYGLNKQPEDAALSAGMTRICGYYNGTTQILYLKINNSIQVSLDLTELLSEQSIKLSKSETNVSCCVLIATQLYTLIQEIGLKNGQTQFPLIFQKELKAGFFYMPESTYKIKTKYARAVGCLQIWPVMVKDVNRITASKYTLADRYNRQKSIAICRAYMSHYGKRWTIEQAARHWNSGPSTTKVTDKYWNKVRKELK